MLTSIVSHEFDEYFSNRTVISTSILYNAELFLYKPSRPKVFFQFEIMSQLTFSFHLKTYVLF